jgi:hypothetical protein
MSVWTTTALRAVAMFGEPLTLPEPQAPPPQVIEEKGESPRHFRRGNDLVRPTTRLGFGAAIALAGDRERARGRFALDVLPGAEIGLSRGSQFAIAIDGGYSYAKPGEHYFLLGAGPVYRGFGPKMRKHLDDEVGIMSVSLLAHGLAGTVDGQFASGVRTSALLSIFVFGVEVGHQYAVTELGGEHDLRVMAHIGLMGGMW